MASARQRSRSTAIGGWSLLLVNYRGSNAELSSSLAAKGYIVSDVGGTIRVNPGLPARPAPQGPADNTSGTP